MKAQIRITGQISGNFELARKMRNYTEKKNGMFNAFTFSYNSIKEAKDDLRQAYKSLCDDDPEMKGKLGGIRKSKDNSSLYYDASQANIEKIEE